LSFIEIFQPKKASKISIFCGALPKKQNMGKNTFARKMIDSTSGIYGKIFRLLAFVIEELDKIQFDWEAPSCPPI
jgi:hypothetical protein